MVQGAAGITPTTPTRRRLPASSRSEDIAASAVPYATRVVSGLLPRGGVSTLYQHSPALHVPVRSLVSGSISLNFHMLRFVPLSECTLEYGRKT